MTLAHLLLRQARQRPDSPAILNGDALHATHHQWAARSAGLAQRTRDAGLQPGDIILNLDGRKVQSSTDLPMMVGQMKPGTTVKLGVWRKGKEVTKTVKLGRLEDGEKVKLCEIASEVLPTFVKTSTGFSTGGATVDDVRLMREHVDPRVKVKAAGGIRTADAFLAMVAPPSGCATFITYLIYKWNKAVLRDETPFRLQTVS